MQQAVAQWNRLVAQGAQWVGDLEVEAEAEEVQPFLARIAVLEDISKVRWRGKMSVLDLFPRHFVTKT